MSPAPQVMGKEIREEVAKGLLQVSYSTRRTVSVGSSAITTVGDELMPVPTALMYIYCPADGTSAPVLGTSFDMTMYTSSFESTIV